MTTLRSIGGPRRLFLLSPRTASKRAPLSTLTSKEARAWSLGARLAGDHTKSLNDAIDVAHKLGIDVPSSPTPSQQWELQTLTWFKGEKFNNRCASLEVSDHHQDIEETKAEIEKGTNRLVRNDAKQDLSMLREHLRLSRKALAASPAKHR